MTMIMTCDNDCTMAGWIESIIHIGEYDLHVSYDPEEDMDGTFHAFCHDEQEMIAINGWLIDDIELQE